MCIAIMKKRRFLNVCRLIHLQDTKIEKKNRKPDLAYGSFFFENTLLQGIKNKVKDKAEVLYAKGCELVDDNWPESELIDYPLTEQEKNEIDKAVANVNQADVAVVVLGGGHLLSLWNTRR